MSVPFVGRDEEMRRIGSLIEAARREAGPAAVLITGEPGSGKSRLLREAVARTDPRRTVHVVGFEPTEPTALAAAGDLIRRLAAVPEHGPRLQSLAFGSGGLPGQGALAVFEAAYRAVAAFGLLTIAIDDLQWADAQSIALVHYLISATESTRGRLIVLAAGRPSPQTATFLRGVEDSLPEARRLALDLGGLPRDDGIALALAVDPSLEPVAAANLWERASGSPFWLEALARGRTNASLADVVTGRLRNLSPDAAEVLSVLAVGARPFGRADVAELVGWLPDRAEHSLDELVARGLVLDERGAVRLTHDLIREAITGEIPVTRRRDLHRRLADFIESQAGQDPNLLAEVLEHRSTAGIPTAELAIRLVESPQRRLLARDDLARLSGLADGVDPADPARARLHAGIGRLAAELGEPELSIRHWSRAAVVTEDPGLRQQAHLQSARAAYVLRRADEAKAHLAKAAAVTPSDPVIEVALAALEADVALWLDPDTSGTSAKAMAAVELGTRVVDAAGGVEHLSSDARSALLAAHEAAADAAMREERGEDAIRLSEMALSIAEGLDEEARLAAVLKGALRHKTFGHFDVAEQRYREAWETAHRLILPLQVVDAGQGLARLLRDMARVREATAIAQEASELESRIGVVWRQYGTMTMVVHSLELQRGEPGAIGRLRKDAEGLDPHPAIGAHLVVGMWLAREYGRERLAEVEAALEAARAASAIARCPRCGRDAQILSAEALARIGRIDDARRELATFDAGLDERPDGVRDSERAQVQAVIGASLGQRSAVDRLRELAATFEASGRVGNAIWTWLDLGALLRRLGDRAEAIEAYAKAAALAEPGGAIALERLASRALRELGVRAWRRGRGAGRAYTVAGRADTVAGLSPREREIAGLVAEGATNRDIATRLVLSPKTVERHVTNILAKAGVRNRTELAGLIHAIPGTGYPR